MGLNRNLKSEGSKFGEEYTWTGSKCSSDSIFIWTIKVCPEFWTRFILLIETVRNYRNLAVTILTEIWLKYTWNESKLLLIRFLFNQEFIPNFEPFWVFSSKQLQMNTIWRLHSLPKDTWIGYKLLLTRFFLESIGSSKLVWFDFRSNFYHVEWFITR